VLSGHGNQGRKGNGSPKNFDSQHQSLHSPLKKDRFGKHRQIDSITITYDNVTPPLANRNSMI